MKTSIQENNAHHGAKLEKLKGRVEGQRAATKASDAVRSKVAKAKELLEANDLRLKDTMVHH